MVLPLLAGLAGSALAGGAGAGLLGSLGIPTLLAGSMSPLVAGSIGSGIGSLLEGKSLGEAATTGATSFMGGKMLGGLAGKAGDAMAGGSQVLGQSGASLGTNPASMAGMLQNTSAMQGLGAAVTPAISAAMQPQMPAVQDGEYTMGERRQPGRSLNRPDVPYSQTGGREFDYRVQPNYRPMAGGGFLKQLSKVSPAASLMTGKGMFAGQGPLGIAALSPLAMMTGLSDAQDRRDRADAIQQGGITGLKKREAMMGMQEGGQVGQGGDGQMEMMIADEAVKAVRGEHPQPEMALARFVQTFGEDALRQLVSDVRTGRLGTEMGSDGRVTGPGDGMADTVPAQSPGGDVMMSDGEFVVPADVVSDLGNGSTDAGADQLYEMMDRVRMARGGAVGQPPRIEPQRMMPA